MIKRILVLVPDQVKLLMVRNLQRRPQGFSHPVECSMTYQSQKEHQRNQILTSDQGVNAWGLVPNLCLSRQQPNHDPNHPLPKRCHRRARQRQDIHLLRLYHPECKPREEDMAPMQPTKVPPVTPHNRHRPQSTLSWTNGGVGGTRTVQTKVAAREDLRAAVGQEGQSEVGVTIHDNYIIEEKVWAPGVA